ncbi:helix-turn-helix domain-containing protein [Pelagibacterium montanilacus]|uniref:helix-turn-helix domain-containing protein n=1 Tax=Pelagibacterium montanilacus TaxID=2185280 RepID=UPI000F8CB199|nr:helix-turn-helix domain-containing protein [Pelagibacterium montanilacus]
MLHFASLESPAPVWTLSPIEDAAVKTLRAHDPLTFEGDKADRLFEVLEGVIRVYKVFQDGRRQIMSFAFPGDIIGFAHEDTYSFDCDALVFSRVRAISKASLLRTVRERPELGEKMLAAASRQITAAQNLSIVLCRKSALERVASFLCTLAGRHQFLACSGTVSLPMTRADIADYLGLTIETVSRNITKLRGLGVISLPKTGYVQIENIQRLQSLADCEVDLH